MRGLEKADAIQSVPDQGSAGPVAFQELGVITQKTPRHLQKHKVCGQGMRATSFIRCILSPVRIVK